MGRPATITGAAASTVKSLLRCRMHAVLHKLAGQACACNEDGSDLLRSFLLLGFPLSSSPSILPQHLYVRKDCLASAPLTTGHIKALILASGYSITQHCNEPLQGVLWHSYFGRAS